MTMPMQRNSESFQGLIRGNLEWLLKQPRTLERDHIEAIVREHLITPPAEPSAPDVESVLADTINYLFTLNDTVAIVSYDSLDGDTTLYRIEDEIGNHLTGGYDTWQRALLELRRKAKE